MYVLDGDGDDPRQNGTEHVFFHLLSA
jgi:hypothetical protein